MTQPSHRPALGTAGRGRRSGMLLCCCMLLAGLAAALLGGSDLASATQLHAEPEGHYAHQMGHAAFVFSMVLLVYRLRQRGLTAVDGWRLIQWAACFFIAWNVDAFIVHYLDGRDDLYEVIDAGTWHAKVHFLQPGGLLALVYYLVRLDHLWCVPAIVLLCAGLRRLLRANADTAH